MKKFASNNAAKIVCFVALILMAVFLFSAINNSAHGTLLEDTPSIATSQYNLEKEFNFKDHSIEDPVVLLDPYESSPLTAIVAFQTDDLVRPTVRVKGKDDKTSIDFTFDISKEHILPIYGLYPDFENEVSITVGNTTKVVKIKTAKLPDNFSLPEIKVAEREELGNDLYFFTPSSVGYTCAYDINGDVRWYLKNYGIWNIQRLQNGHMLLSTERLMNTPYYLTGLSEIDMLGKVHATYNIPGGYHHDYFEMENGNLLVASDNFDGVNETIEDYVVEVERMSGNIINKYDLKKVLPVKNTGNENWSSDDWFHNNSVWYDKESDTIILSGRHADAVIGINHENGELRWIIGDPEGWPEEYKHYFFKPIGDNFEWQWSQHAAMMTPEGYVFIFDNGNNKSKNSDNYVPASKSYSRGVMYKIDTYSMTIEQVWEYGKARGSEFYSPYISDVDYIAKDHYIVHSGGISYKNGELQNQPAGIVGADKLVSDTVEIKNDKVIFEILLPTNNYRVEKLPAYNKSADYKGVQLGKSMTVGSLGKTEIAETKTDAFSSIAIDDKYNSHNITITKQEDRIVFTGTFKRNSNVRLVLKKGNESKYYKLRITDKAHAALCVSIFSEEENESEDELTVTRYVNGEGLSGTYNIYLEVYDQIYDLDTKIKF